MAYLAGEGLLSFLPVCWQRRVRPCRYYFIWLLRVQTGYEVMHIIIDSGVPGSVPPADTPSQCITILVIITGMGVFLLQVIRYVSGNRG